MPHNLYQWFWFVFYTVGSLGGWIVAIVVLRAYAKVLWSKRPEPILIEKVEVAHG